MKKKAMKRIIFSIQTVATTLCLCVPAFAAGKDVSEVTNGIDTLKTLTLTVIGGVGVIFLALGLVDFGSAYSAHDSTQQGQAIKKVIGGLVIVAVPTLVGILT